MSFLTKILGTGIKEVVGEVADIADKFITSPDEKKAFLLEVERLKQQKEQATVTAAQTELDAYLRDVQSARESNTRIQEAEKSSWMARNIAYLIDILVTALWATLTGYIVMRVFNILSGDKQPDMSVVLGIYAAITAQFTTVISYHRGSSSGSASKEKTINRMAAVVENTTSQ